MSDGTQPAVIKLHDDGPLLARGPVTVLDADGTPYEITRKTFFLCRCGASQHKPFCDGSHARISFAARHRAEARAPHGMAA
jgi:CDGSH-type Zn-finger protein